jgi:hypothetical protein
LAAVLAILLVLTLGSFLVAEDGAVVGNVRTVLVVAIAAVKLHLVGMRFMELRAAPMVLRWLFRGWIAAVAVMLVVLQHR